MIKYGYLNSFIQGGINENFEFKFNDNTEVYNSCSSVLNGEVFVFGGSSTSNNRRKQVNLSLRINFIIICRFRSQKLWAVN